MLFVVGTGRQPGAGTRADHVGPHVVGLEFGSDGQGEAVDAALARAQREDPDATYWDLDLPLETTEYVPKLLALRRIMFAPERFGFEWPTLDNTPRTRAVELPSQIEVAVAAMKMTLAADGETLAEGVGGRPNADPATTATEVE